jgi:hypothetical protein
MILLTLNRLLFPNNGIISTPIVADFFIKGYYQPDSSYSLIEANVNVGVDGTIQASPLPAVSIDPTQKYVLKAVNDLCGFIYTQSVILNPYCPPGYALAEDGSYCFYELTIAATPPTGTPGTLVAQNFASYGTCGSYIYDPGYAVNGTGPSTQISLSNPFWKNGGTCADNNTTDGPLNRSGLWANTIMDNQEVGFGVCLDFTEDTTVYIGIGCDNYGIIQLDGAVVIQQDPVVLAIEYPSAGSLVCFRIWHIYPVLIPAGSHILELIGFNVSGPAALGVEVYNNTAAEIAAATDYTGLNLIFSSKNYVGQPVQIGTGNVGYTCPATYALQTCSSPFQCVKIVTTPVIY